MLAFPDGVDRGPHVTHDVVLIEDNLRPTVRHVGQDGLHVGLPHVHGDGLDRG